jgi:hypothetical protein
MRTYLILSAFLLVLGVLVAVAIIRSQRSNDSDSAEFVGKYTSLFETSAFVPCDQPETRYWLVWGAGVDLTAELKKIGFEGLGAEAYLRFDGKIETGAPGGYGHLGQYVGQLEITRLFSASRESLCD